MLAPSQSGTLATLLTIVLAGASGSLATDCAAGIALCDTSAGPMMKPSEGFSVDPVFTVGESIKGYRPPGVLDGIAAYKRNGKQVRLLVNHELHKDEGYVYQLANGLELTGARVSYFDIHRSSRKLSGAGPAYTRAYDRYGSPVSAAGQINESGSATGGFDRLCSSSGYVAGQFGFVDTIYFTHEEANEREGHPHGGTVWAIDVDEKAIWALPALGRGAWENVTALPPPHGGTIALALGDDYGNVSALPDGPEISGAPLYVFIGRKDTSSAANFPARNGLSAGQLYFFKAAESCAASPSVSSPLDFYGTGISITGVFCPIAVRDTAKTGSRGYDDAGYLNAETLRATALSAGAFAFSRPEDLHVNPSRPSEFVPRRGEARTSAPMIGATFTSSARTSRR
jgi:serralysin